MIIESYTKKYKALCGRSDACKETIKNSFGSFDAFKRAVLNGDEFAWKIIFMEDTTEKDKVLIKWGKSRNAIKKLFLTSEIMPEPNDAENKELLKLIRDDKDPYKEDPYIKELAGVDEDYFDEDYLVIINREHDLENFLLRKIEAGRVILGKRVPQTFLRLFEKIKECYMFGLYEATIIFCRALLEEVLGEHIKKKDKAAYRQCKDSRNFIEMLIDKSSLPEILKKEAHERIRKPANNVLHEADIKEFPITRININTPNGKELTSVSVKLNTELQQEALSSIRVIVSAIENLMKGENTNERV